MADDGVATSTALEVVLRQVAAFNAHDLPEFLATYAPDAVVTGVLPEPIAGADALAAFYAPRFEDASLRCVIDSCVAFGESWIVAREFIESTTSRTETIATFDVAHGLIQRASMLKARS